MWRFSSNWFESYKGDVENSIVVLYLEVLCFDQVPDLPHQDEPSEGNECQHEATSRQLS